MWFQVLTGRHGPFTTSFQDQIYLTYYDLCKLIEFLHNNVWNPITYVSVHKA